MRFALALAFALGCGTSDPGVTPRAPGEAHPGGETGVLEIGPLAFSLPARNLDAERRGAFAVGNNVFSDNWVTAPSSTSARDGLGPRYDALSCSGCHMHDGRGRIEDDGTIISAVVRLSWDGAPLVRVGSQLQRRALLGLTPEGTALAHRTETVRGLVSHDLVLTLGSTPALGGGADPIDALTTSLRVAPQMIGLGLLEAIPEDAILRVADEGDADGDGISGRPNRVLDLRSGTTRLGRFGWKANQPSVEQQVAGALAGDIGITSSLVPDGDCAPDDSACRAMPSGGTPEIDDELFGFLVLYSRTLAVPDARDFDEPEVLRGRALFDAIGCDGCHVPSHETGTSDIPALEHQRIWPYTDLLLHDMGSQLSDGRDDFLARGSEWRTPPLWGIGLIDVVNGHEQLLHDGRARGVDEAIRWHRGEADGARQAYEALPESERAAVVRFVRSL